MKIPKLLLPLLVVGILFGGYFLRSAFTKPTTLTTFKQAKGSSASQQLKCTVSGLKCKGTANMFTKLFEKKEGIGSIETFAAEHLAVISYNPEIISPDEIIDIMEVRIPMGDGTDKQVFKCLSAE